MQQPKYTSVISQVGTCIGIQQPIGSQPQALHVASANSECLQAPTTGADAARAPRLLHKREGAHQCRGNSVPLKAVAGQGVPAAGLHCRGPEVVGNF